MSREVNKNYKLAYDFVAESQGELTVAANSIVKLLEDDTTSSGWVLVQNAEGKSGYVPTDFLSLAPVGQAPPGKAPPPPAGSSDEFKQHAAHRMSVAMPPALQAQSSFNAGASTGHVASSSGDLWKQREAIYGYVRMPIPPQRRFFYRDLFGDMQGPFDNAEMKQRLDSKHIQSDTTVVMEVNTGQYEERPLKQLYARLDAAFQSNPVLMGGNRCWYYLSELNVEQGPFNDEQMRTWLDQGYFNGESKVRDASSPSPNFQPLRAIFSDPELAFPTVASGSGNPPPQQTAPQYSAPPGVSGGAAQFAPRPAQPTQQQQVSFGQNQQELDPFAAFDLSLLQTQQKNNPGYQQPPAAQRMMAQQPPQSSGRSLLQEALQGPGNQRERTETMEDTLDLFDKIDLSDEVEKPTAGGEKKKKEEVPIRVYGGTEMWLDYKGIPSIRENPQNYATNLYSFFTRPLNPSAKKVMCYLTREVEGLGHISHNKFILYLENGNVPIAVAYRHNSMTGTSSSFEIKILPSARDDNLKTGLTVAKLDLNFLGTQFVLHNAVQGHQGRARDLAVVLYEANRMGNKGPRKMRIGLPGIEQGKAEFKTFVHGTSSLLSSLQAIGVKDLIPLINKPPKWNPAKQAFSLDFGGRVTKASVKNFQLVDPLSDPDHLNVILQHGRVTHDKFSMDVKHPMSLLQAFAICLSSLHQKKAVD